MIISYCNIVIENVKNRGYKNKIKIEKRVKEKPYISTIQGF